MKKNKNKKKEYFSTNVFGDYTYNCPFSSYETCNMKEPCYYCPTFERIEKNLRRK